MRVSSRGSAPGPACSVGAVAWGPPGSAAPLPGPAEAPAAGSPARAGGGVSEGLHGDEGDEAAGEAGARWDVALRLLRVGAFGVVSSGVPTRTRRPEEGALGDAGETGGTGPAGGGGISCAAGAARPVGTGSAGAIGPEAGEAAARPEAGGIGCPESRESLAPVSERMAGAPPVTSCRGESLAPVSERVRGSGAAGPRIPSRAMGADRTAGSGAEEAGGADASAPGAGSGGESSLPMPGVGGEEGAPVGIEDGTADEACGDTDVGRSALPLAGVRGCADHAAFPASLGPGPRRGRSARDDRRPVRVRQRVSVSTNPASPLPAGISGVRATRAAARPSPGVVEPSAVTTRAPIAASPGVLPVHARTMMTSARSSTAEMTASGVHPLSRPSAAGGTRRIARSMAAAPISSGLVGRRWRTPAPPPALPVTLGASVVLIVSWSRVLTAAS